MFPEAQVWDGVKVCLSSVFVQFIGYQLYQLYQFNFFFFFSSKRYAPTKCWTRPSNTLLSLPSLFFPN